MSSIQVYKSIISHLSNIVKLQNKCWHCHLAHNQLVDSPDMTPCPACPVCAMHLLYMRHSIWSICSWNPPYSYGAIVGLSWELIQICLFLVQGVKKGDRVSIYLPMIPELVYTMLACARIGAIHSIVVSSVINRLFIYANVASVSEKQMSAACYIKIVSFNKNS